MNEETRRLKAMLLAIEYASNYRGNAGKEFTPEELVIIAEKFYNFMTATTKGIPSNG
jgi:hypothetical protein